MFKENLKDLIVHQMGKRVHELHWTARMCCFLYGVCFFVTVSNCGFRLDSTEMDHSENEDISLKRADTTDKVFNALCLLVLRLLRCDGLFSLAKC